MPSKTRGRKAKFEKALEKDKIFSQKPQQGIYLQIIKARDPQLIGMWIEVQSEHIAFIHFPNRSITAAKPNVSFLRRIAKENSFDYYKAMIEENPNGHK